MQFSNVVGQQMAKEGLLGMWRNNVLPHALLIVGKEGTGGLPLALALAQYVFCENKTATDSCGKCSGCSKAIRLEHADLHLSFPSIAPKSGAKAMSRHYVQEFREFVKQTPYGTTYDWLQYINAENKQGNITADECRVIIDALNLKSYEGGRKVLIMWRPEYLGKEGNILLKLIEEPPADTLMIFVAENTEDILQTIRSRTQDVRLAPIPAADIAQALISRANTDPTQAAQIAQIAMGSYSEALRLVRHADNDLFQEARQLFNCLFLHNGVGIAKLAEDWSKIGREQQKNLLQYLLQLMEHTIRVRYRPETVNTLPAAEAALVQKLATAKISHEGLSQMAGHLSDTCFYIERNAHAKTQLLALMIRLHSIIRSIPAAAAQ